MNKLIKIIVFLGILFSINLSAQENAIPKVQIKDMYGKSIDASTLNNEGKPFVIDFWATWCTPCIRELTNIHKVYEKWQQETGVKFLLYQLMIHALPRKVPQICQRQRMEIRRIILMKISDLKRAMNAGQPPQTYLFDGNGKLVWQHSGYAEGNEDELYSKIKELIESPNQEIKN